MNIVCRFPYEGTTVLEMSYLLSNHNGVLDADRQTLYVTLDV